MKESSSSSPPVGEQIASQGVGFGIDALQLVRNALVDGIPHRTLEITGQHASVLKDQPNGLQIAQAVLCGALNELAGVLLEPRFLAAERPLSKPSDCRKDKGHQRKQTDSGRRWF